MSQETPKQPVPGATIEAPNPQFSAAQRLSYIKVTKDNNVVLKLEAEKHRYLYESLYFKMMTEQLLIEDQANKAARASAAAPQPQQEAPATSGPWEREPLNSNMVLDQKIEEGPTPSYDAEATTSGSMEELVGPGIKESPMMDARPIMELHRSDAEAQ